MAEILGLALQSRSLGCPSVLANPGVPFPPAERVGTPSSALGSTGKSPLGPSSYSPSHGFTFVLSNRSDRLPASMAVFKVHLWGTQTECSDKPGRGAVCVPGASWDPGWGWGPEQQRGFTGAFKMKLLCVFFLLWLGLAGSLAQSDPSPKEEESYSDWGLRQLRGSFESVNSYVDSFMELLGGKNGVCQYRCRYGEWVPSLGVRMGVAVGSDDVSSNAGRICPTPGRTGCQAEQNQV